MGCCLCDSELCCDHQKGSQFSFGAWKQLLYFLQLIMSVPRALQGGCIPSPSVDMPVSCSKEGSKWWFPFAVTLQSPEAKCCRAAPSQRGLLMPGRNSSILWGWSISHFPVLGGVRLRMMWPGFTAGL